MKNIKKIIGSALLATAFAATSVGTTFALFTDEAKTTITVGSGIVNIENSVSLVRYQSSVDGTNQAITGNSYSNELVGNNFSLSGSIVNIEKMVPGDKLTVKLSALNKSNVRTKTRYVVSHATIGAKGDLFPALKFTFNAGSISAADLFKWQSNSAVAEAKMAEGVALYGEDGLLVTIELPDSHNGALTFGSENLDNKYQDKACSISFDLQAVQGNATVNPIDEINAYLQAEKMIGHENHTMHDAVLDMKALEYNDLSILSGYVYDLANDQFVAESSVSANYLNYFKTYSSMPDTQSLSIYAVGDGWTTINSLTVGFDAGDVNGITSITYDRHEATDDGQEVTIRTNTAQTALTINAPHDTIHHYDALGSLNIIEAATASYHEFGSIAYAEIAKGRIVLEKGSDVDQIHVNKKAEEQAFDTVIITLAEESGTQELPEKITRDAVTVSEETLVVKVESNGSSENVYVYADGDTGTKGSTEKVTEGENKQNENVESALGQLVLDNGGQAGEKAQNATEKAAEKEEAVIDAQIEEAEKQEHELIHHDHEDPTCVNPGHNEYYSYMDGENEVKIGYKEIPATGVHIADSQTGKCSMCGLQMYFFKVGQNLYASNQFSAAWSAAMDSANAFEILCNMTMSALPVDGVVTVDLKGHTLNLRGHSSTNGGIRVYALTDYGGDLTLKNGTLNLPGTNYSQYGIYCNGNLTLKDLTINSACSTVIYVDGQTWNANGTATLDNVTINATNPSGIAYRSHCVYEDFNSTYRSPMTYIKNSTINGAYDGVDFQATNAEIENTTITATNNVLWANFSATGGDATGNVVIKGTTNVNGGSDYSRIHASSGNTFTVVEGTYNFNPSSYVNGDSYMVKNNGDGTWTVELVSWIYVNTISDLVNSEDDIVAGAYKLMADISLTKLTYIKTVSTIDLNGHTLSNYPLNGTGDAQFRSYNGNNTTRVLNLKDSSAGKTGKFISRFGNTFFDGANGNNHNTKFILNCDDGVTINTCYDYQGNEMNSFPGSAYFLNSIAKEVEINNAHLIIGGIAYVSSGHTVTFNNCIIESRNSNGFMQGGSGTIVYDGCTITTVMNSNSGTVLDSSDPQVLFQNGTTVNGFAK